MVREIRLTTVPVAFLLAEDFDRDALMRVFHVRPGSIAITGTPQDETVPSSNRFTIEAVTNGQETTTTVQRQ